MEKKQQLSQAIATVERQISEAKSETAKKALTAKLGRLKEDLRAEKSGGVSSLTTLSQARKVVKALDKTAFEKLVEKLSEKPEYAFLKDYSQDRLRRDALRTAKPRGYRFKGDNNAKPTIAQIKKGLKDGTVYYEGRPIRSDVNSKVRLAKGGHVSKGEMVWNKLSKAERLDFLYENFTPQITPITQEAIQHKRYVFLPKNVKIVLESKYANVEEYAKGGGVGSQKKYEIELFFAGLSGEERKIGKYVVSERTLDKLEDEYSGNIEFDVLNETESKAQTFESVNNDIIEKAKSRLGTGKMAKGGGVSKRKTKGDVGKSGTQYAYTLEEYELAGEKYGLFVSPSEFWKSQEGTKYEDSFGRTQTTGERDKEQVMMGYGYRIAIGLDLGSKKIPASAKKYVEENNLSKFAEGGNIDSDISKYKKQLIAKAKAKGLYENFGQDEVRKLEDKYGYTDEVRAFDNWAMNFDLSSLRQYGQGGNIEFRSLAKSNNFDIIVPEGRFEVELDSNKKVKSVVHPSGERHQANECPIYQKYKKEIKEYLTERFENGGNIASFNWKNFTLKELSEALPDDVEILKYDTRFIKGFSPAEAKNFYTNKKLTISQHGEAEISKGGENIYLEIKCYNAEDKNDMSEYEVQIYSKENHAGLKEVANSVIEKMKKGGAVSPYTYLPKQDISKIVLKSKQVIGKSRILDGAYIKEKLLKGSRGSSFNVISKSAEEVSNDIIKYVKENYKGKKFGKGKDYYFTEEMVQILIDAGYTESEIKAILIGIDHTIKVEADNEFTYDLGGVQNYSEESKAEHIQRAVEAAKNNAFELGLKYPNFDWKQVIKKYKINLTPVEVKHKIDSDTQNYSVYVYACFVGKDIVIGATTRRDRYKGGKFYETIDERDVNEINGQFNGGYWGVVSSKKEVILDVAKMLLSQKDGSVKDVAFISNNFGGVGSEELIENKIKFEEGGVIRKMYAGDAVLYKGDVWYITEKEGELGIINLGSGAYSSHSPFIEKSKIDMSQLTDMMGRKVEISKITYHARGGNISNESKNLSSMTGASDKAIENFFNENGLDHMGRLKVTMGVGRGHLSRKDFATAIAGERGNKYAKEIIDYVKTDRAFKMAKGGNLGYTYIPNEDIEKIIGTDGTEYGEKVILDGAYVTDKVRTPKMSRTQFEEDVYAYGEGGGISKSGSKIYKLRAEGLNDFLAFLQNGMYFKVKSFTVEPLGIPDVVVTFETDSSLSEIKEKLREIPDSHVMLDTVKPINEYTGDREEEGEYAHGGSMYATGGGINVSDIKKEKQKMLSELFEKCGVFFAFSDKQFEENKTPLKEGEKYVSIGGGGYLPKGKVKEFQDGMEAIERYGKQKVKKNNLAESEILDELQNHECFYTGDISDVVDLFEGTYTVKQIRDVYNKYREENQEYATGGGIGAERVIGKTTTGKSIYQKYNSIPDLSYEELKEASDIFKKFSKKAKSEEEKQMAINYSVAFMRMANEEKFAKGLGKYATGGEITPEEREQALKNYPKLNL